MKSNGRDIASFHDIRLQNYSGTQFQYCSLSVQFVDRVPQSAADDQPYEMEEIET